MVRRRSTIQAAGLQIVLILVGAFVGLAAVGGLRAITTLFGPLGTFYRAMELPALSAMSNVTETRMPRVAALYALLLVPVGVLYASLMVAAGQRVVLAVFGVAFTSFDALILPMGITYIAMGIATIPALALRTMEEGRTVLAIESLSGVGLTALALVLLPLSGVLGAAWAYAIAGAVQTVLFMAVYSRRHRSQRTRASQRTTAASRVAPEIEENVQVLLVHNRYRQRGFGQNARAVVRGQVHSLTKYPGAGGDLRKCYSLPLFLCDMGHVQDTRECYRSTRCGLPLV